MSHFISLKYFSAPEISELLGLASQMKAEPAAFSATLKGKSLGLLFEKSSLRTKTAFYIGGAQLGAVPIYYAPEEVKLGEREKVGDAARTLSEYLDVVVLRTYEHEVIREFAKYSRVPVINGLTDRLHPSQALADVLTIQELKGEFKQVKVAYVGDGNNVCNSLLYAFAILGGNLHLAIPEKYFPDPEVVEETQRYAQVSGARITLGSDAPAAAKQADVIYTDVWTSMGKEKEQAQRKKAFKNFQINDRILTHAKGDVAVMHCLPAHRGQEITDSVLDGKHSVVFQQAANRLHAAKAIMAFISGRHAAD